MTKKEIIEQLHKLGVKVVANKYVHRKDVKKIVDAADTKTIHTQDNILEGMTFDDLITAVQNDSAAYNQMKDRKALEFIIVREYDKYLISLQKDARYTLNQNMDFIVAELMKRWKN